MVTDLANEIAACEHWNPDEMYSDMRRRFASGSFMKLVKQSTKPSDIFAAMQKCRSSFYRDVVRRVAPCLDTEDTSQMRLKRIVGTHKCMDIFLKLM